MDGGPTPAAINPRAETKQLGYVAVFDDPTLELIRLLRDGAEIEHSLLIQYLYAAFSVRLPEYAHLAGWPNHRYGGRPLHLMGMANRGDDTSLMSSTNSWSRSAQHLTWAAAIPLREGHLSVRFMLEPLTETSLAKYVYVGGHPGRVDPDRQANPKDQIFVTRLTRS